jgi:hypothetical protein
MTNAQFSRRVLRVHAIAIFMMTSLLILRARSASQAG